MLMNVPLIFTPAIEMQCVLTLKAVSLVPVTLVSLVMAFCAVSKINCEGGFNLYYTALQHAVMVM